MGVKFVTLSKVDDLEKEDLIQDGPSSYATVWAYCGMNFMMQFVKEMGKDSFDMEVFGRAVEVAMASQLCRNNSTCYSS